MKDALPICPRCNGYIPSNENPGAHLGAMSRLDNTTEVCSQCGTQEAREQLRFGRVVDWRHDVVFHDSIDAIEETVDTLHELAAALSYGTGGIEDDCASAINRAADELRRLVREHEQTGACLDNDWD